MLNDHNGLGALVPVARLWARTSQKGNRYISGFLGDAKILILENRDHDPDDPKSHSHQLFITAKQPR